LLSKDSPELQLATQHTTTATIVGAFKKDLMAGKSTPRHGVEQERLLARKPAIEVALEHKTQT
jgi:hypothetical protein